MESLSQLPPLQFATLHDRLVARLRDRVHNGETTERSLARLTGISQPHIHNVLKGTRLLSTDLADLVLHRLHLSVLDLLEPGEIESLLTHDPLPEPCALPILVLDGRLGPGFALPWENVEPGKPSPPVAVRLAPDPDMENVFGDHDFAIVDRSPPIRATPVSGSLYVLGTAAGPRVRRLRWHNERWTTASDRGAELPIDDQGRGILNVVLAHVVWITRRRRPAERASAPAQ